MKNSSEQVRDLTLEEKLQLQPISGPVLGWLPGETLYSLVSRNHFFRGHKEHSHTLEAFFGTLSGISLQSMMSELEVFEARTGGRLGTAEQILEERTLFRFYRLFMRGQNFDSRMKSADSLLKFPLGVRTGRFRKQHPLKNCLKCMVEDLRDIGFAYWQLEHQYPGVWVCLRHNYPLREATVRSMPHQKVLWQTPFCEKMCPVPAVLAEDENFARFKKLATLIVEIARDYEQGIGRLTEARSRLLVYLKNLNLIYNSGRLKMAYKNEVAFLCQQYLEFTAIFRKLPEFEPLPADQEAVFKTLAKYVNGTSVVPALDQVIIAAWIEQLEMPRT